MVLTLLFGMQLGAQGTVKTRYPVAQDAGIVSLYQAVKDAGTDNLALLVASHPDDRYVLPATWLRFHRGWRVAVLLFTRGRGGQNSQGPETGDALGQLRTLEAEACASHMGAKIYYLNRPDQGFSRSAEETLAQWNEAESAADAATLIRRIRPDLVLTTHHPEEIHGHDLALLRILRRALVLSADASHVTEGHEPFVVQTFLRGVGPGEEEQVSVSLPMGQWDELRGRTYRQLAYRAMLEHRSQRPLQPLDQLFAPILELVPEQIGEQALHRSIHGPFPDLFRVVGAALTNEDRRWLQEQGFPGLATRRLDRAALARHCLEVMQRLRKLEGKGGGELRLRLARRMEALERVLLRAAGVHVFMEVPDGIEAAPGDELPLHIWMRNEGAHRVHDIEVLPLGKGKLRLSSGRPRDLGAADSLPIHAIYEPPDLSQADLRGIFTADTFAPPLRLQFRFSVDGQPLRVERLIPTALQPAVQIQVTPRTLLLPAAARSTRFVVALERKTRKPVGLRLRINAPAKMVVPQGVREVSLEAAERYREFGFELNAAQASAGVSVMHVHAGSTSLRVRVHKVDVKVPDTLRVGLIPGVDATIYEVLQSLVGDARLRKFETNRPLPILDPQQLDTLVVDTRALRAAYAQSGFARVLEYAKQGGRVVVFYHKDQEFNLETVGFRGAPYPLLIGKGRVTREDAPVRLLRPDHPLFHQPNKIRVKDWDGWQQERGLYFPKTYDPRYVSLLEMRDPGEPAERGALLYAEYGAGTYIYCALALHRQLKNRHAGACRIFANLITPRPRR